MYFKIRGIKLEFQFKKAMTNQSTPNPKKENKRKKTVDKISP
jgi:hypothetical protein